MILTVISLSSSCTNNKPQDILVLVDISSSNEKNISNYTKSIFNVYGTSAPNDKFTIYYFSSIKLLAYSGGKLNKDRVFESIITNGYEKAKQLKVNEGTSFQICKLLIEQKKWDQVYLFTDGYFEKSNIEEKILNQSPIKVEGLEINNNERVLNMFSKQELVALNFQGN